MSIKFFAFLALLSLTFQVAPIIPKPPQIYQEYHLNEILLQGTPSLGIINSNLQTTLKLDGEENDFSFTLKATDLPSGAYYPGYSISFGKTGTYSIQSVTFSKSGSSYTFSGNTFSFQFKLYNNEELNINVKYSISNPNLFELYRFEYIGLRFGEGYPGSITVIGDNQVSLMGVKDGVYTDNGNSVTWSGTVPNGGVGDYIIVGAKKAYWNAHQKMTLTRTSTGGTFTTTIRTSRLFKGGSNTFSKYDIQNNMVNYIDNNYIKEQNDKFVFTQSTNGYETYYQVDPSFNNEVLDNWNFTLSSIPESTATEATIQKAQEILASDTTGAPVHVVLGRWVYSHMTYNINYVGRSMTVDQILTELVGVCEHFTRLYNALLQSVGIDAIYTTGYAFNSRNQLYYPESSRHAWTIAKINQKWVPLDATWSIFGGKIPVCHVFQYYHESGISWSKIHSCSYSMENDLVYLGVTPNLQSTLDYYE